ncbi:MAG: hydrogen gas-evolving membrane-bound hydrogenase subunit E, partial [Candidatus Thermoplasmatota archaeon]|nr:hydrogen gas-evolving membrane-bound hydrogenase subunit E [Candidatus Thermoplasmatota archaeon]
APDLAMTQFLFETLTVLVLLLVLRHLPGVTRRSSGLGHARDIALALGVGATMTLLTLAAVSHRPERLLAEFFGASSYLAAHGRNVVNVILVDFRALDTLGEVTVLAVAAVGVYALLKLVPQQREGEP